MSQRVHLLPRVVADLDADVGLHVVAVAVDAIVEKSSSTVTSSEAAIASNWSQRPPVNEGERSP